MNVDVSAQLTPLELELRDQITAQQVLSRIEELVELGDRFVGTPEIVAPRTSFADGSRSSGSRSKSDRFGRSAIAVTAPS
ncbi:MAG: hypothetical protein U0S48_12365 [Solirubrobacteraceae bacterium]